MSAPDAIANANVMQERIEGGAVPVSSVVRTAQLTDYHPFTAVFACPCHLSTAERLAERRQVRGHRSKGY
jgi:hypothetical protein